MPNFAVVLSVTRGCSVRCVAIYLDVYPLKRPFGEQTQLVTTLAERANQRGIDLIVLTPKLTPDDLGYRYTADERSWTIQPVPEPDIVLRRSGAFRRAYERTAMADLASYSADGRLHTLPRSYSNKWNMHQMLQRHNKILPHLPRTTLAKSAEEIYQEVVRRQDVYVKPLTGARGRAVYHLVLQRNQLVAEWDGGQVEKKRRLQRRSFHQPEAFYAFWRQLRLKQVIVQDTVALPRTADGRAYDFRWLVQYTDKPIVVARVGRLGQPHAVTTNIHSGGEPVDAAVLLKKLRWNQRRIRAVLQQMDDLAIATAEALKNEYGPYAELGIDFALCTDGGVRLFEVNSTPGRRMLRQLDTELRQLSLDYLLEYAIKAAGFAFD